MSSHTDRGQSSPPKQGNQPENTVKAVPQRNEVPRNASLFQHQVAGHGGIVQGENGTIEKPIFEKERAFYEFVNGESASHDLKWILNFIPKYFGTRSILQEQSQSCGAGSFVSDGMESDIGSTDPMGSPRFANLGLQLSPVRFSLLSRPGSARVQLSEFLVLEDVTRPFSRPCILDLKCGTRTYDDNASPEKVKSSIRKSQQTTSGKTGIRFSGMKRWGGKEYEQQHKSEGRKFKEADLLPQTRWFFSNGPAIRKDVIGLILEKLMQLSSKLSSQRYLKFYSSSLLIVYEGDELREATAEVRIIDFARSQGSNGELDLGFIKGVKYFIEILKTILEED